MSHTVQIETHICSLCHFSMQKSDIDGTVIYFCGKCRTDHPETNRDKKSKKSQYRIYREGRKAKTIEKFRSERMHKVN